MNARLAAALLATSIFTTTAMSAVATTRATELPEGYWTLAQTQPILDKTLTVRLAPDLTRLTSGERAAAGKLIEAGRILHNLFEDMNHRDARRARADLAALQKRHVDSPEVRNLVDLYRLSRGPIATDLANQRFPFVRADTTRPGRNFYPWGVTKEEIEQFLSAHPERRATILHPLTIVRRADSGSLRADLATLARYPALDVLHPGLAADLREMAKRPSAQAFYAVPHPVAYPDSFLAVHRLLNEAATAIESDDSEFADYLRLRARDLLANDYEGGDAAWVTGRFGRLNAQIGAYETYDDELFGVKASHGLSLMLADSARTAAVRGAIRGLQELENSLPYAPHKRVREDIPVGVYDVIADFGQTRGANTATILPNDSRHARRYGRTILLRRNIMNDSNIVKSSRRSFEAALDRRHHADFDADGGFYRTLWHEIGHYLGPDRDRRGRDLDQALLEEASTFEEMKADLVSLFVARELRKRGYYDERALRALYASGVLRMLNKTQPRPDESYGVMQLMQLNWFLDQGALVYDKATKQITVRYERYPAAVASLLEAVTAIQANGDRAAADRFIARWATWDARHESLGRAMRATETSRYRLVRFAALGE